MTPPLPDTVVLCLYNELIVPWETKLKTQTGCWDSRRTHDALQGTGIHLECVEVGRVGAAVSALRKAKKSNFIVFVSHTSQMQDLFRHIRNCAAHAGIVLAKKGGRPSALHFQLRGRSGVVIEGELAPAALPVLAHSLVT